jgi:hypothetical protein
VSIAVAVAAAVLSLAAGEPAPRDVVAHYLDALARLDAQRMAAFRVWTGPELARQRAFRGFEREMRTRWSSRIVGADPDGTVRAFEQEANAFYDLLGVGTAAQITAYRVERGRIVNGTIEWRKNAAGDQRAATRRFVAWLNAQPGAADPVLVGEDGLVFDGQSARRMKPWLEAWVKAGRP